MNAKHLGLGQNVIQPKGRVVTQKYRDPMNPRCNRCRAELPNDEQILCNSCREYYTKQLERK